MTQPPFHDASGVPTRRLDAARAPGPQPSGSSRLAKIPRRDIAGWDERWAAGDTPWDLGQAAPPLVRAIASGLVAPPARTLVLGCGAGHDARAFAAAGFDVTGVDLSPLAVARARALAAETASTARFEVADLFALPESLRGADLAVEHTCFCAVDPSDRDRWVDAVAGALRPGGRLLALFWLLHTESGPPFGATEEEVRTRLGRRFRFLHAERPADSAPSRPNEFLTLLERV